MDNENRRIQYSANGLNGGGSLWIFQQTVPREAWIIWHFVIKFVICALPVLLGMYLEELAIKHSMTAKLPKPEAHTTWLRQLH